MPSAWAAIVCSIFIASTTISAWPRVTLAPSSTITRTTLPGMGDVNRPGPTEAASASASTSMRATRVARPRSITVTWLPSCTMVTRRRPWSAPATSAAIVDPGRGQAQGRAVVDGDGPELAGEGQARIALPAGIVPQQDRRPTLAVEPPAAGGGPGRMRIAAAPGRLRGTRRRRSAPGTPPPGRAPGPRCPAFGQQVGALTLDEAGVDLLPEKGGMAQHALRKAGLVVTPSISVSISARRRRCAAAVRSSPQAIILAIIGS